MIRDRIQAVLDLLRRAVTEPRSELDRWEKALRFAHDLGKSGARQLRQDRAPQMAGALTFRTLFGARFTEAYEEQLSRLRSKDGVPSVE